MVVEHVPDEAERRWIEPAMLALLGIGTESANSEQLFAAWRTFFERMAETGLVALVFEDLHWADSGTLDFIEHMLEWSRSSPIFIVTLARPDLLERRSDWGAGKRNFTSLYLEPLPEEAMRELLAGLVPGLPENAVRAIVGRADGIPLYAVETVRTLLAEGRLALEGDRYVPTQDLATLSVPETLQALIAARLDALDPVDRSLVSVAAVLGQSFTLAGLAAVTGNPEEELEPSLRDLVRRELFVHIADPRSPERGQYAFVQGLIREVAYSILAKRDRKSHHIAAARYFESVPTDELSGALAQHYFAAHENAPTRSGGRCARRTGPNRPESGGRARDWPGRPRPGGLLSSPGPHDHDRSGRRGCTARAGRNGRLERRPPRGSRYAAPAGRGAEPGGRRRRRHGPVHDEMRRGAHAGAPGEPRPGAPRAGSRRVRRPS